MLGDWDRSIQVEFDPGAPASIDADLVSEVVSFPRDGYIHREQTGRVTVNISVEFTRSRTQ